MPLTDQELQQGLVQRGLSPDQYRAIEGTDGNVRIYPLIQSQPANMPGMQQPGFGGNTQTQTTATGAFGSQLALNAAPAAVGGYAAGTIGPALANMLIPAAAGVADVGAGATGIGALAIPLITGIAAAAVAKYGQGKLIQAVQTPQQQAQMQQTLAAQQQEHPWATLAGGAAANIAGGLNPSPSNVGAAGKSLIKLLSDGGAGNLLAAEKGNLANVGLGAGLGGAITAGGQLASGQPLNLKDIIEQAAIGSLFNRPNAIGTGLYGFHPQPRGPITAPDARIGAAKGNLQPAELAKILRGDTTAQPMQQPLAERQGPPAPTTATDLSNLQNAMNAMQVGGQQTFAQHQQAISQMADAAQSAMRQLDFVRAQQERLQQQVQEIQQAVQTPTTTSPEVEPNLAPTTARPLNENAMRLIEPALSRTMQESAIKPNVTPAEPTAPIVEHPTEQPTEADRLSDEWDRQMHGTKYQPKEQPEVPVEDETEPTKNPTVLGAAVKLFQKMGALRNIRYEYDTGKLTNPQTGEEVNGMATMRQGIQETVARLNPFNWQTFMHEGGHIFFDDMAHSPVRSDQVLHQNMLEATAKSPEFKSYNDNLVKMGKQPVDAEEFLQQYQGQTFERDINNYKPSLIRDTVSAIKTRWLNPNMEDVSRVLQNKFFRDPSFAEAHGLTGVNPTVATSQEDKMGSPAVTKYQPAQERRAFNVERQAESELQNRDMLLQGPYYARNAQRELGINPAKSDPDQVMHSLQNATQNGRINPTEFEMYKLAGLRQFLDSHPASDSLAQWMTDNGPKVEIHKKGVDDPRSQEVQDADQRFRYMVHRLETIDPNKEYWKWDSHSGTAPSKMMLTGKTIPPVMKEEIEGLVKEHNETVVPVLSNQPPRTVEGGANWSGIAPKLESSMPGYVEGAVTIPLKTGSGSYEQMKPQFPASHNFPPNTLGFFRGYMEDTPQGKTFHIIETQSDWAQKLHKEKGLVDYETQMRLNRGNGIQDHPLLKDWERLTLKAAIQHAISEGADKIAVSDAPTAMMTEGHDRSVGDWDVTARTGRPLQEPGMRLHYDNILPKLLKELTGSEGEKESYGEHKMAWEDAHGRPQQVEGMPGRQVLYKRINLIFRNPDGTPKTDVSATSFDLGKIKERGPYTMLGRDKADVQALRFQNKNQPNVPIGGEELKNGLNEASWHSSEKASNMLNMLWDRAKNSYEGAHGDVSHLFQGDITKRYMDLSDRIALARHILSEDKRKVYWLAQDKNGKPINANAAGSKDVELFRHAFYEGSAFNVAQPDKVIPVVLAPKRGIYEDRGSYGFPGGKEGMNKAGVDIRIQNPDQRFLAKNFPEAYESGEAGGPPLTFVEPSSYTKLTDLYPESKIKFQNKNQPQADIKERPEDVTGRTFKLTEAAIDKERRLVSPKMADVHTKLYNTQQEYMGRIHNPMMQAITDVKPADRLNVLKVMDKEMDTKEDWSGSLQNQAQQNLYRTLRDKYVEQYDIRKANNQPVQTANGNFREAIKDPYYSAIQGDQKSSDIIRAGTDTKAIEAYHQAWLRHNESLDVEPKTAEQTWQAYVSALRHDPGNVTSGIRNQAYFNGVRRSEGTSLPPEMREMDLAKRTDRYTRRSAADMAHYKEIESDPEIAAMHGYSKDGWGNPIDPDIKAKTPDYAGNQIVQDIMNHYRGSAEYDAFEHKAQAVESAATISMLGPITQPHKMIATVAQAIGSARPEEMAGIMKGFTNWNDKWKDALGQGGVTVPRRTFQDNLHLLMDSSEIASERLRGLSQMLYHAYTLGGRTDKFIAGFLHNAGEVIMSNRIAKANAGDATMANWLRRYDPDYEQGKQYGPNEIEQMASRFAQTIHGARDPRNLPAYMLKDNEISAFLHLAHWGFSSQNAWMRNVYTPATKGDFTPLLMSSLGGVLGGYVIKKMREEISGRKTPIPTWEELEASDANAREGLLGRRLEDNKGNLAYNLMELASISGFGGLMTSALKMGMDVAHENSPSGMGTIFPLDEVASSTIRIGDAIWSAMANGDSNWFHVMQRGVTDWISQNVQTARVGMNLLERTGNMPAEYTNRLEYTRKLQDLRRFKVAAGLPHEDLTQEGYGENPYMNLEAAQYKREPDIATAMQELPPIIHNLVGQYGNRPTVLMAKLEALKKSNYETMPSMEDDPLGLMSYEHSLQLSQGQKVATDRLIDYIRQHSINSIKSSLVP